MLSPPTWSPWAPPPPLPGMLGCCLWSKHSWSSPGDLPSEPDYLRNSHILTFLCNQKSLCSASSPNSFPTLVSNDLGSIKIKSTKEDWPTASTFRGDAGLDGLRRGEVPLGQGSRESHLTFVGHLSSPNPPRYPMRRGAIIPITQMRTRGLRCSVIHLRSLVNPRGYVHEDMGTDF